MERASRWLDESRPPKNPADRQKTDSPKIYDVNLDSGQCRFISKSSMRWHTYQCAVHMTDMLVKYCSGSGCRKPKNVGEFGRNASRKDGLQSQCKICNNNAGKRFYAELKAAKGPNGYDKLKAAKAKKRAYDKANHTKRKAVKGPNPYCRPGCVPQRMSKQDRESCLAILRQPHTTTPLKFG